MTLTALILLVFSAFFVLYTYVGYPWLVGFLSRRTPANALPALLDDDDCPSATILICAFNEESRILRKLKNCLAQDYPADKLRILVVSDGSDDETINIIEELGDPRVSVLAFDERRGKAACLNDGFAAIDDACVFLQDVRQQLSETACRTLASSLMVDGVGAVSGELIMQSTDPDVARSSKGITDYWSGEVRLRRAESELDSVVGATGAIYALRREAFQPIPSGTILDDVLIPMNAALAGWQVKFDPRANAFDEPSRNLEIERNRKIRTLAGNFQIIRLQPNLVNPRLNRLFWQYLSHKVFRLLVPAAMVIAFLSSAYLSVVEPLFIILLVGQIVMYALSMLPESAIQSLNKGPIRLGRTFVIMHWFVVLGFLDYRRNNATHLWSVSSSTRT